MTRWQGSQRSDAPCRALPRLVHVGLLATLKSGSHFANARLTSAEHGLTFHGPVFSRHGHGDISHRSRHAQPPTARWPGAFARWWGLKRSQRLPSALLPAVDVPCGSIVPVGRRWPNRPDEGKPMGDTPGSLARLTPDPSPTAAFLLNTKLPRGKGRRKRRIDVLPPRGECTPDGPTNPGQS
jgi:hypothetical protein